MFAEIGRDTVVRIDLTTTADLYFFDRDQDSGAAVCGDIYEEDDQILVDCTFRSNPKTQKGKEQFNDFGILMPVDWDFFWKYAYDWESLSD